MCLTELPLGLKGRVFRCPMPLSNWFDPEGRVFRAFDKNSISVVVVLAEVEESLMHAGCDLRELYAKRGLEVIHLPVPDGSIPAPGNLDSALDAAVDRARDGRNVAIHCHAGIGRTGVFAACLARKLLGLTGAEALNWVRQYVPGAAETAEQRQFIFEWKPG